MVLYLHVGTNKTASSFLQSSLVLNRQYLEDHEIYLPQSRWDRDMEQLIITPGNGHRLAQLLLSEDSNAVSSYLKEQFENARKRNLNAVLLSNEIIIRLFSNRVIYNHLYNAAIQVGFKEVACLCVLRNPFEHALSLFKHRGKSGNALDYKSWFFKDYETIRLFREFSEFIDDKPYQWHFRKYFKDGEKLLSVLYNDFLKIETPQQLPGKNVNPSLTLNQIELIKLYNELFPASGHYLHGELIKVGKASKENLQLVNEFMDAYYQYINTTGFDLSFIVNLLPLNEQIGFLDIPEIMNYSQAIKIQLSGEEIMSIRRGVTRYHEDHLKRWGRNMYRFLRGLIPRKSFDRNRYGGSLRM